MTGFLHRIWFDHKRNMRSGGSDSDNVGICENIRGNVKINNPYVNLVVDRYNIQVEPLPYEYGTATGVEVICLGRQLSLLLHPYQDIHL